jgi:hypothetical protein
MSVTNKSYTDSITSFAAADANSITQEINVAVQSTGQTLNSSDNEQTSIAMNTYAHNGQAYTDSGSANARVLSPTQSTLKDLIAPYRDGMKVRFKAGVANSGGTTVNVSGIGVVPIFTAAGDALIGGEIQASSWVELVYDASEVAFLITNTSAEAVAPVPFGHLNGFNLSNNVADSDHDIDFAVGVASDQSGLGTINNLAESSLTKQIDNTWVAGNNLGGRPAAVALSINTWYACFAIAKTTGEVDFGFDSSAIAANLLAAAQAADATWLYARRIGWVKTDGSSNICSSFKMMTNSIG